ncbi:DgyrCDS1776 [Dimorphilus gyrociliatus]|uniref:DgyrCDS1776 n=1 Tax=Dimorphilus gyrociliatus TaxID=2664684 RepID=A0A7I8V9T1_9ANNE|nr:DgyrCDS1776 [Dimorphilus gyrociliatus]
MKLPSHRYRYSVWHDLNSTSIKGHELKAPRIREGPPEKEKYFYRIKDSSNNKFIHHNRRGKDRLDYRDSTESWENLTVANLSYQDLAQPFQKENFKRVLRRLTSAKDICLLEDDLVDLKTVTFPECESLTLSRNHIPCFKNLPKFPKITHLDLSHNYIRTLSDIKVLAKYTNLKSLIMKPGNPVVVAISNYRQKIFRDIPSLLILDNLPKLEEDDIFDEEEVDSPGGCSIS